MFGRLSYRDVVTAEADRRIAHGEEPEHIRLRARRDSSYRKSEDFRWDVIQAVMRGVDLDPGAYRRLLAANADALSKRAKELEDAGHDRFARGDRKGALRCMQQALELAHSESREGMAQALSALVRHEDQLMLAEVPSLADVMWDDRAMSREPAESVPDQRAQCGAGVRTSSLPARRGRRARSRAAAK